MKPLTDFDNQVLVTIVKQASARHYAEPPRAPAVEAAIRHLANHKMIVRARGTWWLVRPTEKALKHIAARKRSRRGVFITTTEKP